MTVMENYKKQLTHLKPILAHWLTGLVMLGLLAAFYCAGKKCFF